VDIIYYRLVFIVSTPYYSDILLFKVLYSNFTVLSVARMKRLSRYFTVKLNLALYLGILVTVLFTLLNGLAGRDFWSTPLYKPFYEAILRLPALPITPPSYRMESILRRTSILLTNYDSRYSMRFDILRVADQGLTGPKEDVILLKISPQIRDGSGRDLELKRAS